MKIEELKIKDALLPAGKSITSEAIDNAENALFHILYNYVEYELKSELRIMLNSEENAFLTDYQLMKPAEIYKLIDAANLLQKYFGERIINRLKKKAEAGDKEAASLLQEIK